MPPSPIRWSSTPDSRHRHAGPGRGAAPGLGVAGQRARLRHPRNARAARLPAGDLRGRCSARPLILPTIATWWCGQRGRARACPRQYRPHDDRPGAVDPAALRGRATPRCSAAGSATRRGRAFDAWLDADGAELRRPGGGDAVDDAGLCRRQAGAAADDPARLSRAHAAGLDGDAGRLRPRRLALDTTAIAMQRGGQAADVWVVSEHAGRDRHAAAAASRRLHAQPARAACPAAPPTT